MTKEKRNYKEYFVTPFFGGVFALTIICFLIKIDSFLTGIIVVLIGSIIFSALFGSLLILTNKKIRPKMQKYFLNYKSIRSLEKLDIGFNDTMNCYFGTYRGFDVQVFCHFDKMSFFETEYVMNIFFEKIDSKEVNRIRKKEILDRNNLAEFFIQKVFNFRLFPPSETILMNTINDSIDLLERNYLNPIKLKDLGGEFNNIG